jgi:uncharacterized protein YqeY
MPITEQLNIDLRAAMRDGNAVRRDTLRMVLSSLHNAQIAAKHELSDDEALGVLAKEAKQRRESIEEFRKANRQDLVDKEQGELDVLTGYLPAAAPKEEIVAAAREVIAELGAAGPQDVGKVMPVLMAKFRGRADGRDINAAVRELLA